MRILITRLFAAAVLTTLLFTSSKWIGPKSGVSAALFFVALVLVAIASLGRMWCSLYIAGRKDRLLVREGPYSISRNPLYFFSFIGIVGAGLSTETFTVPLILAACFLCYYPFVIRAEEEKLEKLFPAEFPAYRASVPRFFPRTFKTTEPESYLVNPMLFRRHMLSAFWFILIVGLMEVIEELHSLGIVPVFLNLY